MLPRADAPYTMAVKVIYLVILGLLLGLCSAVNSTPVSSPSCRGYCEIFSHICKNGGTCVENTPCSNTGKCKCPPNYGGEHCQKPLNPGEGDGAEKTKTKPRVKNNLLLTLFRNLAVARKSPNELETNPKPTEYHKNDSGTSSPGQVKLTTKQTTTTSTTTTTPTPTTTTTPPPTTKPTTTTTTTTTTPTTTTASTTTTATTKPTTAKPTESMTATLPVTTDVNSDEFTTLPSETLLTTDDRLDVVSEETTTDGTTEVSTSTEFSQETSASVSVSQTKLLPTAGILPTVAMTKSIQNVNDNKISDVSVSGQKSFSDDQETNSRPTSERLPANDRQTQQGPVEVSSTIVTPLIDRAVEQSLSASQGSPLSLQGAAAKANQQPQTNVDIKKQETDSTNLIKASKSSLVSIASRALESVTAPYVPFSDKPGINIALPETSTRSKTTGEERVSTAETSSSSSKEQITTPSFSVTKLLQKMLTRPILDSISKSKRKDGTSTDSDQSKTAERQPLMEETFISNIKKAFEKAIIDKSKEASSITATEATPALSDSSTNGIPAASKKNSAPVVGNVTKKVSEKLSRNGTGAAPKQETKLLDKINNLTDRLTQEFAKNLKQIITSVFSESDSTTSIPKAVASTKNMDIIIPENVNNLMQMDKHLSSRLNLANKPSKQLASTLPEKLSETSGIQPKVEGQILAESPTTSPQDVQSTTSSSAE